MKYIRVGTYTFPLNKPFHIVHRNEENEDPDKRVYQNFYFLIDRKMMPLWSFFFSTGTISRMHENNNKKKITELVIQVVHLKIKQKIIDFLCSKEYKVLDLTNTLYSLEKNWLKEFVKELGKESRKFQHIEKLEINIISVKPSKEVIQHLDKTYIDGNGKFLESEYKKRSKDKEKVTEDISVVKNNPPPFLKLVSNG